MQHEGQQEAIMKGIDAGADTVTYDIINIGELRLGPADAIRVCLVKFRRATTFFKAHLDIRLWKYSFVKKDFIPTVRGITVTFELLKHLFNYINALPDDMAYPLALTELKRWPRDAGNDLVLQLGTYKNEKVIDIRLFILHGINSYTGFSKKGVQFALHNRPAMAKLLEEAIYKYIDLENKDKLLYNKDIEEGGSLPVQGRA